MLNQQLNQDVLETELFDLVARHPLDDFIDALETSCRRRAGDLTGSDKDIYLNLAVELRDLKAQDLTEDNIN